MKLVVDEKTIRKRISEMLSLTPGWSFVDNASPMPASVSAVVDPSAAESDPGNEKFRPKNRMELKSALSVMIDNISDDDATSFYEKLRSVEEEMKDEDEEMNKLDKKIEETIRLEIRKILRESGPYRDTGLSYSGPMTGSGVRAGYEECEACEGEGILDNGSDCSVCKGTGAVKSSGRKNVMMTDVGGSSFKEIAQEMGYASESGAKQAIEKALEKARFAATMDEDELQILVLTAMNDYVDFLRKSGELTAADVQLMKDHPNIVSGLDGFRDYLDGVLKKSMRSGQKVMNPVED
jgi:hypothetical protein